MYGCQQKEQSKLGTTNWAHQNQANTEKEISGKCANEFQRHTEIVHDTRAKY